MRSPTISSSGTALSAGAMYQSGRIFFRLRNRGALSRLPFMCGGFVTEDAEMAGQDMRPVI
jgi:hypothetical protein